MNARKLGSSIFGLTMFTLVPAASAEIAVPLEGIDVNLIGVAVASVPDYWGSAKNNGAFGPYGRYQFQGTERYVELLGPQVKLNLLNDRNWRLGPILRYRSARDKDVDDRIVKQMDKVDSVVEGGVFVGYKMPLSSTPLHQITFNADVEGGGNGTEAHLSMMYMQPFSKTVIGNIGLGVSYGNSEFMENYFGVTSTREIALYPALGGRPYDPSSGIAGWNIPFGVSAFVSQNWIVSGGGRYEKLIGDASNSPVVKHGDSSQWMFGLGVAYLFK